MKELILGHAHSLGFDPNSNCPTTETILAEGKPKFE
jgi:hypothetical protein